MTIAEAVLLITFAANALALTLPITIQVGGLIGSWLAGLVEQCWRRNERRKDK